DLVGGLLLPAEQAGEEAAAPAGAVQGLHRAGAVQGDAGLRALAARLHEDGGGDADLAAARRGDVHLAERSNDLLDLRHRPLSWEENAPAASVELFVPARRLLPGAAGAQRARGREPLRRRLPALEQPHGAGRSPAPNLLGDLAMPTSSTAWDLASRPTTLTLP